MQVRVRQGDTLSYYSRLFSIPLPILMDSNPGIDPIRLQPGQMVKIPGFMTESYEKRKGDTLQQIAALKKIPVDSLLLLNGRDYPGYFQDGETVRLPVRIKNPLVKRGVPYDFSALSDDLEKLRATYPFIRIETIGYSVLGKPLYEIRFGRGDVQVHLNASFHANEWITSSILMALLNTFLLGLTNGTAVRGIDIRPLYYSRNISIVPMVDPDGVDLVLNGPPEAMEEEVLKMNKGSRDFSGWKANIRGVDLNNQYPAKWEIEKKRKEPKSPAPRDYPGDAPLTEPEAIAMADLVRKNDFARVVALHTQGKEFYWGYEGFEPPEAEIIARQFEKESGYKAVRFIDSHAGFKDWFIQEYKRPGFTLELGEGVNPLPLTQYEEIYEDMLGLFLASIYL